MALGERGFKPHMDKGGIFFFGGGENRGVSESFCRSLKELYIQYIYKF